MKKILTGMFALITIPLYPADAQNLQSYLTLESKSGFSTNTFLNPFLSEWDRTESSGYSMISPIGQVFWNGERVSVDFTGAFVVEPFFDGRDTWHGGLVFSELRYRVASTFVAGAETGGSYFSSFFSRNLFWVQPKLTWIPSLFTKISFKAGPMFRDYDNFGEQDINDTIAPYALEFETWPGVNWQVLGGIYGNLSTSLDDNLSGSLMLRRLFNNRFNLGVRLGADRFDNEIVITDGGPGGPPFGGIPSQRRVSEATDILVRTGISAGYEIFSAFSVTMNLDHVTLFSTGTNSISDAHIAAGVRYTFPVKKSGRKGSNAADARWDQQSDSSIILNVNYEGNETLYITGDFNRWEIPGEVLTKQKRGRYAVNLNLEPGVYEYKILAMENGTEKWIEFSEDTFTVDDGFGGDNGLMIIE